MAEKRGPSMGLSCTISSGFATNEALRAILNWDKAFYAPWSFRFDSRDQKYSRKYVRGGNRNILQRIKIMFGKRFLKKSDAHKNDKSNLKVV